MKIWIYLWLSHREGKWRCTSTLWHLSDYFWRTGRKTLRFTYTQTIIIFSRPFNTTRLYRGFILDKQFGCFNRAVPPWVYLAWDDIIHLYSETLKNYSRFYEHTICANKRAHMCTCILAQIDTCICKYSQASIERVYFLCSLPRCV